GFFFFQAEDGIRDKLVTGVQTCALPISSTDALAQGIGDEGLEPRREVGRFHSAGDVLQQTVDGLGRFHLGGRASQHVRRRQARQIGRASCRERVESAGGAGGVEEKGGCQ